MTWTWSKMGMRRAKNIRRQYAQGAAYKQLAEDNGVTESAIYKIIANTSYHDPGYESPLGPRGGGGLTASVLMALGEHALVPAQEVVARVRNNYGTIHGSQVYRALSRLTKEEKVERRVVGKKGMIEFTQYRRLPAGTEAVMS